MMLPIGTKVQSKWTEKKVGYIVGYGSLMWPTGENLGGDDGIMQPVYLIQVEGVEGSNALQQACIVLRADHVKEV